MQLFMNNDIQISLLKERNFVCQMRLMLQIYCIEILPSVANSFLLIWCCLIKRSIDAYHSRGIQQSD